MTVISCPRRCSRLITAAIFLSAGIVQLIAGLVLLRSEHVSLLSVPDFWAAISNIGVGCLIGLLASVWKHDRRSRTINAARRHMVMALYISSLFINVSTSVILILGEGNTLLSVREIEKSELSPESTLASEILSYAYAASVISPITCSVVSFICLQLSFCPEQSSYEKRLTKKNFKKKLGNAETYSWVYTPEISRSAKSLERKSIFRSSCGGCSDRSSMTLSSSFSGFASGLGSPVPKMHEYSNRSKIGTMRATTNDVKQPKTPPPAQTSPNDTDVSFEESGSTPPIGELVPIHLGMRSSKRQSTVSVIPVEIPIAPERDWSSRSWTVSPSFSTDNTDPSTKPKTVMHFRSPSYDSSGEDDASPKSSHDKRCTGDYHKSKRMMRKEHKKMDSSRRNHLKRPDLARLKLMESINECPVDYSDDDDSLCRVSPTTSSGYGSTLDHAINCSSSYGERELTSMEEMHCGKKWPSIVDLNKERTIQDRLNAFKET